MVLSIKYLQERHQYWAQKLYKLGIFKYMLKLLPFEIKYNVKSYNGMFCARKKDGVLTEKIILYPNIKDVDSQWVDNILVHEMIHQYIYDYCLKDTSSHGFQFKTIMNQINRSNIGVKISVSEKNYQLPKVKDYLIYKILFLKFSDKFFLCKVKSTKVDHFTNLIVSGRMCWKQPLLSFGWYKTKSTFFQNYAECTSRLHGAVFHISQLEEIFKNFELQKFEAIQEL